MRSWITFDLQWRAVMQVWYIKIGSSYLKIVQKESTFSGVRTSPSPHKCEPHINGKG
ncbi:hypothetical protein [Dysgonomonas sp.]|uniref:hypothetical protein n=1 Tax=Dysgonomonas sp. TaxID=1891233 RepID=UPI0027B8DCB4|nr:hypothetical protein [Dysgonomonas sp.]